MEKTGLVIEGGGVRGIYAAGVLDVLLESELHFDGVIGVSAGAIHGCSFVAGQKGRSIRYYKKYCTDKRFMSFWSLFTTGNIVGTQFCYYDLPERLDPFDYDAYQRADTKFYAVSSNLETGKAEYIEITDMHNQIEAMRASASLPYVSRIVEYDGKKLLDGGCTDSIPVKAFQKMGYARNVVILTRDDQYLKKPENALMAKLFFQRKYPNFCKALLRRHRVYNRTVEEIRQMEAAGRVFVIRPSEKLVIDRMSKDPEEVQRVYDIGRKDAKASIAALEKWLSKV